MKFFNEDERIIKAALEENRPESPDVRYKVLSQISKPVKRRGSKRARFTAAVTAAALVLSVAVYAAYSSFSKLIENFQPEISQYIEPVETSCESNGIRMELVGYYYNGQDLVAYLNFEDTEGLGRVSKDGLVQDRLIQESLNLTGTADESYDGNMRPSSYSEGIRNQYYDEETGILSCEYFTSLFEIKEFKLEMSEFIYDCEYFEDIDSEIDLSQYVGVTPETQVVDEYDFTNLSDVPIEISGTEDTLEAFCAEPRTVLSNSIMDIPLPISTSNIQNIGFYSNQLHILQSYKKDSSLGMTVISEKGAANTLASGGYAGIYLIAEDGAIINSSFDIMYGDLENETGYVYADLGFNVDEADLEKYKVAVQGRKDYIIKGDWEISVPVSQDSSNMKTAECSLIFDNFRAEEIIVTPYWVKVIGSRFNKELGVEISNAELTVGDEVIQLFSGGGGIMTEAEDATDKVFVEYSYEEAYSTSNMDISNVTSITLGDYTIELN